MTGPRGVLHRDRDQIGEDLVLSLGPGLAALTPGAVEMVTLLARRLCLTHSPSDECRGVMHALDVAPNTLQSRLYRAGLPSLKRLQYFTRLYWFARSRELDATATTVATLWAIGEQSDNGTPFFRMIATQFGIEERNSVRALTSTQVAASFLYECFEAHRHEWRGFIPAPREASKYKLCATQALRVCEHCGASRSRRYI